MNPIAKTNIVIAIDPGYSTGVAVFQGDDLLRTRTVGPPYAFVASCMRTYTPRLVVIERPPENPRHQADATLVPFKMAAEAARNTRAAVRFIAPSQWKKHPFAQVHPLDTPRNQHERDAVRMGRYFLKVENHLGHSHS